jgi:hypothetical protein
LMYKKVVIRFSVPLINKAIQNWGPILGIAIKNNTGSRKGNPRARYDQATTYSSTTFSDFLLKTSFMESKKAVLSEISNHPGMENNPLDMQ